MTGRRWGETREEHAARIEQEQERERTARRRTCSQCWGSYSIYQDGGLSKSPSDCGGGPACPYDEPDNLEEWDGGW